MFIGPNHISISPQDKAQSIWRERIPGISPVNTLHTGTHPPTTHSTFRRASRLVTHPYPYHTIPYYIIQYQTLPYNVPYQKHNRLWAILVVSPSRRSAPSAFKTLANPLCSQSIQSTLGVQPIKSLYKKGDPKHPHWEFLVCASGLGFRNCHLPIPSPYNVYKYHAHTLRCN